MPDPLETNWNEDVFRQSSYRVKVEGHYTFPSSFLLARPLDKMPIDTNSLTGRQEYANQVSVFVGYAT